MKNLLLSLLFIMPLVIGCNNKGPNSNKQSPEESAASVEKEELLDGTAPSCYLFATDKDTIYLKLDHLYGGKVRGKLNYNFFEKDGNTGQIEGEIHGDTLFADYTFQSEGMISVREVAFFLGEDQVREGYGDAEEKDGKMVFKNRDSVDFNNGPVMPAVPCRQLE